MGRNRGRSRCIYSGPASPALPAQLVATLLIQYERLQGVQSSGVLIIFWFLCVVCAIIPFRSKILSAVAKVRGKRGTYLVPPCLGCDLRAQGQRWVPRSSPLSLPGSQDIPCGSVFFCVVLYSPYLCWKQVGRTELRTSVT